MATREDYLRFLAEKRLSEDDVAPIMRRQYWSQEALAKLEAYKASLQPNFVDLYDGLRDAVTSPFGILEFFLGLARRQEAGDNIAKMESSNANLLLQGMVRALERRVRQSRMPVPDVPIYHGVYPTRRFNAVAHSRGQGYLVLVESATLEIIEVVTTLVCSDPNARTAVVNDIETVCRSYWTGLNGKRRDRYLPAPVEEYELQLVSSAEEYAKGVALTSAAEEFAIAHEWGHINLGHRLVGTACAMPQPVSDSTQVVDREQYEGAWEEEFSADLWAIGALLGSSSSENADMALAGALLFVNLGRQIEGHAVGGLAQVSTHPPAAERVWMLDRFAERYRRTQYDTKGSQGSMSMQVRAVMDEAFIREFGVEALDRAVDEEKLAKLYKSLTRYIFPYCKELFST